MSIKRKGILARPGEYRFGDTIEVKTAEELKAAVERQPILTLTLGHPAGGMPRKSDYIGTVTQKWNEEKQRVDGDFWFYDEYIPDEVRKKIVNLEPVSISAGYTVDSVEDGLQRGILYSHIAVLQGEDPKCPLDKCGVNVRMESDSDLRYEQEQPIDEPRESVPEVKEAVKTDLPSVTLTGEQLVQFIEAITAKIAAAAPPAVAETEIVEPPVEAPEAEPEVIEEPKVEPEVVVPASKGADPERLEDGGIGVNIFEKKNK
ncbi:MAG: hypothetical protein ACXADS_16230 [Candidatus Thorarchaeota archaeon]|jgi:hypothetical protein